jgi:hypothetical protein
MEEKPDDVKLIFWAPPLRMVWARLISRVIAIHYSHVEPAFYFAKKKKWIVFRRLRSTSEGQTMEMDALPPPFLHAEIVSLEITEKQRLEFWNTIKATVDIPYNYQAFYCNFLPGLSRLFGTDSDESMICSQMVMVGLKKIYPQVFDDIIPARVSPDLLHHEIGIRLNSSFKIDDLESAPFV